MPAPQIRYRQRGKGEVVEYVNCGKWRIRNWFYNTPEIKSWGIIYFGEKPNKNTSDILNEFQRQLPNVVYLLMRLLLFVNLSFFFLVAIRTQWFRNSYRTIFDNKRFKRE